MSIPCNLPFAYQKRYLALLCHYLTTTSPYLCIPTLLLIPIPCNLPFAYQKRYLALLCYRFTIPVHSDATTYVNTMQPPFAHPKRYLALLCRYFTIPVHADATTHVNTIESALRSPETLSGATSTLPHHTCARRRHHSCQYFGITIAATPNAIWRYFAASSPYQLTPKLPLMSIPWNHHFSYQNATWRHFAVSSPY